MREQRPSVQRPTPRSRRGRFLVLGPPALLLLILLFVLALRFLDDGSNAGPSAALPASAVAPQELRLTLDGHVDLPRSAFEFATVERVIDGDTLEAIVGGQRTTIRLFGVQAPERGQACASEALERLRALAPRGAQILLHPGPRNDDGARLLRYLFTVDAVFSIDAALVREGLARAWRRDGQLRDQMIALENRAQAGANGCLWALDA